MFVQSSSNLVKIINLEVIIFTKFDKDMAKKCEFFINGQILSVSGGFFIQTLWLFYLWLEWAEVFRLAIEDPDEKSEIPESVDWTDSLRLL